MKKIIVLITLCFPFFLIGGNQTIDFQQVKRLPVQHEGRVKPLDTVARITLMLLRGNQSVQHLTPIEWFLDLLMHQEKSDQYRVFRIDHPDILGLIQKEGKYFSFQDIKPHLEEIRNQTLKTTSIEDKMRDSYQNAIVKLWQQITLYFQLSNTIYFAQSEDTLKEINFFDESVKMIGTSRDVDPHSKVLFDWFLNRYAFLSESAYFKILYQDQDKWLSMGEGLLNRMNEPSLHPGIKAYATMMSEYRANDSAAFNKSLHEYQEFVRNQNPAIVSRTNFEVLFNQIQPFYRSIILYLTAFILSVLSWIYMPQKLSKLAFYLLIAGFLIHTAGLVARMYLEERPPVTNLYSSAIFVGWGSVLIGILLERVYRNSIGTTVSTVLGSLTLVIAHHLAGKGDTMEMMRAVLNSNFWLSTHVVTITFGYSATFLAGFLACIFIIRRIEDQTAKSMVYGIICFATLFSFVGTVLGGIWADQSWGRFWGWDPKENGALMIVIWNAIILHSLWGGLVKTRGLLVMAVFGNIITSFSWFGVNMLGVGLHSYGFIDSSFFWLSIFILSQLLIMVLGVSVQTPRKLGD